nr:hypothetical protein StreXyl84_29140 [Streptomyces sp. Xyl84]
MREERELPEEREFPAERESPAERDVRDVVTDRSCHEAERTGFFVHSLWKTYGGSGGRCSGKPSRSMSTRG